jgi:hypothetical protein
LAISPWSWQEWQVYDPAAHDHPAFGAAGKAQDPACVGEAVEGDDALQLDPGDLRADRQGSGGQEEAVVGDATAGGELRHRVDGDGASVEALDPELMEAPFGAGEELRLGDHPRQVVGQAGPGIEGVRLLAEDGDHAGAITPANRLGGRDPCRPAADEEVANDHSA